jgi:hypothetical protein
MTSDMFPLFMAAIAGLFLVLYIMRRRARLRAEDSDKKK